MLSASLCCGTSSPSAFINLYAEGKSERTAAALEICFVFLRIEVQSF
jgi:hypothetical protein